MRTPKVSIIVPCHNSEKTLSPCLDSLISQTLSDIEIICINDGSTDETLSMLNEYALAHPRTIKVVNSENQGAWKARRLGISVSSGDYISFLDSDDTANPLFIESMYEEAVRRDAAIVVCGYSRIDSATNKIQSLELCNPREALNIPEQLPLLLTVNTAQWNKLYRRAIISDIPDLEHPPTVLEDVCFNFLTFLHAAGNVTFLPQPMIRYHVRAKSAMTSAGKTELEQCFQALLELRGKYRAEGSATANDVLDAAAFLHLGVSMLYRVACNNSADVGRALRDITSYLDTYFPSWKNSEYLTARYAHKHGNGFTKLWMARTAYRLHLIGPALHLYQRVAKITGRDIKW